MPKEQIRDNDGGPCIAEVRWSSNEYVQVAVLQSDITTFVAYCQNVAKIYDEQGWGDSDGNGFYWTPNRNQLNELIRVLRRARDQAFGRDE